MHHNCKILSPECFNRDTKKANRVRAFKSHVNVDIKATNNIEKERANIYRDLK